MGTYLKYLDNNQDPYFLIGFPRSGTTLLDTILRSHPSIEVLEEIPIINRFIDELYIKKILLLSNLEKLNQNLIKEMREFYFQPNKILQERQRKKNNYR